MATIYDVAKHAGVSSATVSHVINNSRFVSDETRHKVLEAIKALRYRRDRVARSLRRSETGTIGLMISDITNPYFSDLVRGVEDSVYSRGGNFNLVLCNTDEDAKKEKLYLDVLLEKRVDGLIIAPAGGNHGYFRELVENRLPIVFVDRYLPEVEADAVVIDNLDASKRLVSHLIALGHREIAILRATLNATSIDDRVEGYRLALHEAGIPLDPNLIVRSHSDIAHAYKISLGILHARNRPKAVFTTNNFMTLGLMRAVTETGLRCPEDVAIAGVDDFPWAAAFRPRLTVAAQPSYAIGQEAVALLFDRMAKADVGQALRRVVKATIHIRESCGASANGSLPERSGD